MFAPRSPVRIAACLLAVSFAACGNGNGNPGAPPTIDATTGATTPDAVPTTPDAAAMLDAAMSDAPPVPHYQYVISRLLLPTSAAGHTATDYGLDLGSPTSAMPDGTIDNVLGSLIAILDGVESLQAYNDDLVVKGISLFLVDLQTPDLTTAPDAKLMIALGYALMPSPCDGPWDPTCGHHLQGTGTFALSPSNPPDGQLPGAIQDGVFTSGAGDVPLFLSLGNGLFPLNLIHARVQVTGMSPDGLMSINIGGLVTMADVRQFFVPGAVNSLNEALLDSGCKVHGDPNATPPCGCVFDPDAKGILTAFDTTKDCQISTDEVLSSPILQPFLTPDSCSTDTCATPDALSLGINAMAVPGKFDAIF